MPRIQDVVRLRPEVVEGDLHGIISLYALIDNGRYDAGRYDAGDAFERDPHQVLQATYPSTVLKRVLRRLGTSLSTRNADRKGNFVVSGGYGSGKSHLLLMLYHLLTDMDQARPWLSRHGIDFDPPEDALVVLMPMTNLTRPDSDEPVEYLWTPMFHALGYEGFRHAGSNFPTVVDLRKAVAGRRVFLIVDEIERWFMPICDRHQAEANLSFLQNLTEFARDPDNGVIVLLSLLMLEPRIGNVVGRDDAFFDDLTQTPDRRQVVMHRLIEHIDQPAVERVVDAYLEQYKPVDAHVRIGDYNRYRQEMVACYPLHPATIEVVFERYSSVARKEETSYQNSRGALYLLAHTLQETLPPARGSAGQLRNRDLILPGDVSLTIEDLTDDLINLELRLVEIARQNVARSVEEDVPFAAPILSTVLLHSLGDPRAERQLGATFGDILLGTLRPEEAVGQPTTANGVQTALHQLEETPLNLHVEPHPPRWLFKAEVNVVAQINRRARGIARERAQALLVKTLRKLVNGMVYVFPFDDVPDQREVTLVLTTERMESEGILDRLYYGRAHPNALTIVDPRDMASVADDPDLLWMAKRIKAADALRFDLIGDKEAQQRVIDFLEGPDLRPRARRFDLHPRRGAPQPHRYLSRCGAAVRRGPLSPERDGGSRVAQHAAHRERRAGRVPAPALLRQAGVGGTAQRCAGGSGYPRPGAAGAAGGGARGRRTVRLRPRSRSAAAAVDRGRAARGPQAPLPGGRGRAGGHPAPSRGAHGARRASALLPGERAVPG